MLTDGALRMLVLLHFHTIGFTPIQLSYLFLLYEFAGLLLIYGGWIAKKVWIINNFVCRINSSNNFSICTFQTRSKLVSSNFHINFCYGFPRFIWSLQRT